MSSNSVRLWDFGDSLEEPPTIWATEEYDKQTTVDRVFINEGSKVPLYITVITGYTFTVFKDRMDPIVSSSFEEMQAHVTAAAFSEDNLTLYLGTDKGKIHFIDLKNL